MEHLPVLKEGLFNYFKLEEGWLVVDATLGLGGHSLEILKRIGEKGKIVAFEQDERNLEQAKKNIRPYENQIHYFLDNFRYLKTRLTEIGISQIDAILFDLGISSPHVDDKERGFSFMQEGPLDMRFDQKNLLKAYDIVNVYPKHELIRIFREYGEEALAGKIASMIENFRKEKPIQTTKDLAEIVKSAYGTRFTKKHPATKIFQAIRIEVNDEINALKEALDQSFELLKIGGYLAVISYHSLEDGIVKKFFRNLERPETKDLQESLYRVHGEPKVEILTKKPVSPDEKELSENPRSRSAKLRVLKKIKE